MRPAHAALRSLTQKRGYIEDGGLTSLVMLICCIGLVYSSFTLFLTARFNIPTTPVYILIMLCGAPLAVGIIKSRPLSDSSKAIIVSMFVYIALILVQILFNGPPRGDILELRVAWALVTIAAIVGLANASPAAFLLTLRAVVVFSVALIFIEYFSRFTPPFRFTNVIGRAAGLFINPNIAALFLAAALPVVALRSRLNIRVYWYVAISAATILTFSRSGMLLCAIMIVLAEAFPATRAKRDWVGLISLFASILAFTIIVSFTPILDNVWHFVASSLDDNTANRIRLGEDNSSRDRMYVFQYALEAVKDSIIFGRGIGFGYEWGLSISVHNMFALVFLEQGMVGLIWLASFIAAALSIPRPYGLWLTVLFGVGGMFNHNLFDAPNYGVIIAMYAALPTILAVADSRSSNIVLEGDSSQKKSRS